MALLVATDRIEYDTAWEIQRRLAAARGDSALPDVVWLLEHPPVYTFGRHGSRADLFLDDATLERLGATCVHSDRGGQMTWHGPGQTTGYVIADVRAHGGVRRFVGALVGAMVDACGVPDAVADDAAMGAYVAGRKLGSVGINVSGGISTHGIALNRSPDLAWYERMTACGAPDVVATSIAAEGGNADRTDVEARLADAFADRLGLSLEPVSLAELTQDLPRPASV